MEKLPIGHPIFCQQSASFKCYKRCGVGAGKRVTCPATGEIKIDKRGFSLKLSFFLLT
jgi:hypothetical protein